MSNSQPQTNKKIEWTFLSKPQYSLLILDLLVRIMFSIIQLKWLALHPVVVIMIHGLLLYFTLYLSKRKARALRSFLEVRLMSEKSNINEDMELNYTVVSVQMKAIDPGSNLGFLAMVIIIPLAISVSVGLDIQEWNDQMGTRSNLSESSPWMFITLPLFFAFIGLVFAFKDFFISPRILSVFKEGKRLTKVQKAELLDFLNKSSDTQESTLLSFMNDFLIIDLKTKAKIYRERLDNLSYESVFIGALTFATAIQLTSPENMDIIQLNGPADDRLNFLNTYSARIKATGVYTKDYLLALSDKDSAVCQELENAGGFAQRIDYNDVQLERGRRVGVANYALIVRRLPKVFDNIISGKGIDRNSGFVLITIGSLISSAFYVIILLKRFAILKQIERAQFALEKAEVWNKEEEELLECKERTDELNLKILHHTDQVQAQLANTNELLQGIHSNLNIVELVRKVGLNMFFAILLLSAYLIHLNIFLLLLVVTFYGTGASYAMNMGAKRVKLIDASKSGN